MEWVPGGVEVVAHSLRDSLKAHHGSNLGLLKIDFRNAFNEIKHSYFVKAACEMFPAMSSWIEWRYDKPSMLFYDHEHIIESCAGAARRSTRTTVLLLWYYGHGEQH